MVKAAEATRSVSAPLALGLHRVLGAVAVVAGLLSAIPTVAADLYLVDAHSQIDHHVDRSTIVPLMDRAGIRHVILSTRGKVKPEQLVAFAAEHPGRVTASVRTKGNPYSHNRDKYYRLLDKQLGMAGYGAMAEVIMWHAQKGDMAAEVVVPPDDKRVQAALWRQALAEFPPEIAGRIAHANAERLWKLPTAK